MVVIRVEHPLLWVEFDEQDARLSVGDKFVIPSTDSYFQVETIIPLKADGVILSLTSILPGRPWPREGTKVEYFKFQMDLMVDD